MNRPFVAEVLCGDGQVAEQEAPRSSRLGTGRTGLLDKVGDPEATRERPAGDDRQHGEHDERRHHHGRRFMGMLGDVMIPRRAGKRHEPESKHVERGQEGTAGHRIEEDRPRRIRLRIRQRLGEDGVFGVVAGETDHEGDARADDGQTADEHRPRGPWHHAGEAAHLPHVIGMAGVDHGARAEKQQTFEERMRDQVKQSRRPATNPQGQHHVAQLAHG